MAGLCRGGAGAAGGQIGGYPIRFGPYRRGDPLPIGAAVVQIGGVVLVHRAGGGVLAGLAVGGGGTALSYMVAMVCPGAAVGGGALPGRGWCCWWADRGYPIRFGSCRRGYTGAAPQFQAQRFQLEPFQGGQLYLDIVVKEAGRAVWPVLPLLCCVGLVVAGLVVASGGGRGESVALHAFFRRCQNIFCYAFPCIGGGSVQIFFNLFWYSDRFCREF